MLTRLSKWLLGILGWQLHADFPAARKYVLIVAPHTSNWDFPLGIVAAKAIGLEVHWLGKHTLFHWPHGWFFRAIGGIPVYRDQTLNLIEQSAERFKLAERPVLALAPEGTRAKTDHWKTGFYQIARAAEVPIAMSFLDYGTRQIGLGGCFDPGDDIEETFDTVRRFYSDKRGKHPHKQSDIRVKPRQ